MKRNELDTYQSCDFLITKKVYMKSEADKVMDDLEAKLKNLEKANAKLIKRVQELEDENNELEKKLDGKKK